MIGLDTNVLVRYIMQDDAKQSAKANKLIESLSADKPGFIPLIAGRSLAYQGTRCQSSRPGDEGPVGVQGRHG